ncbi:hypothetical protein IT157_02705 [bacterium]|nr:hypothetical protein [bacterium]
MVWGLLFLFAHSAFAIEWISLLPHPSCSRELSMGCATGALFYSPSASGTNPAGLVLSPKFRAKQAAFILHPGGVWQVPIYLDQMGKSRSAAENIWDVSRLLVGSAGYHFRWMSARATFAEPVMRQDESDRFDDYPKDYALSSSQTSLQLALDVHPRIAVGGRVDFYEREDRGDGEGFSYGVIVKPRGVQVGLSYQRYPITGARWQHPLDRRTDQGINASLGVQREGYSVAFQTMNLSNSDGTAFLEPRAGVEWRVSRGIALRGGAILFSRSRRAAWTAGLGLLDTNWLRPKQKRLRVPEDLLSVGVAMIYDEWRPVQGITSFTLAWRL